MAGPGGVLLAVSAQEALMVKKSPETQFMASASLALTLCGPGSGWWVWTCRLPSIPSSCSGPPPSAGFRCRKGRARDCQGTSPGAPASQKECCPQAGKVRVPVCADASRSLCGQACLPVCLSRSVCTRVCMCVSVRRTELASVLLICTALPFDPSVTSQLCTGDPGVSLLCDTTSSAKDLCSSPPLCPLDQAPFPKDACC